MRGLLLEHIIGIKQPTAHQEYRRATANALTCLATLEVLQGNYEDDKKSSMAAFRFQCARAQKCKDRHWARTAFSPSFGDPSCCSTRDSSDCVWDGLGHDDRVFGVAQDSLQKG